MTTILLLLLLLLRTTITTNNNNTNNNNNNNNDNNNNNKHINAVKRRIKGKRDNGNDPPLLITIESAMGFNDCDFF